MKIIRNWKEFQTILNDSKTHYLVYEESNAYLYTKDGKYVAYLNTPTFYNKESANYATKRLQETGFDIEILNEKEMN